MNYHYWSIVSLSFCINEIKDIHLYHKNVGDQTVYVIQAFWYLYNCEGNFAFFRLKCFLHLTLSDALSITIYFLKRNNDSKMKRFLNIVYCLNCFKHKMRKKALKICLRKRLISGRRKIAEILINLKTEKKNIYI